MQERRGRGTGVSKPRQRSRPSWRTRRRRSADRKALVARRYLLSWGELAFYRVLRRVARTREAISLKTRLVDVVGCPDHLWTMPHGRRLAQKHVDFVLYDVDGAKILAVIELDDRTHDTPARKDRDRFLNRVLREAGIPLVRIRAAAFYDVVELRARLDAALRSAVPPRMRRVASTAP